MFEKLSRDELIELTSVQEGPCVSVYLPKLIPKTLKVEYTNLLRQAEHLLRYDTRTALKTLILDHLNSLEPESQFDGETRGLALFVNKHRQALFHSRQDFHPKLIVADSFHLRPLLEEMQSNTKFHVMALTLTEAVFFQNDSGRIAEAHNFLLHQSPHSSSIHWKYQNDSETIQLPHLQSQTRARGVIDNKFKKKSIQFFFKFVESKISKSPNYKKFPLIIFSNEHLFNAFKTTSNHPNPQLKKIEIARGMPTIEYLKDHSIIELKKLEASAHENVAAATKVSFKNEFFLDDLFKISKAAIRGEIQTLFLQDSVEIWGRLRRQSGELTFHDKQRDSRDDDILDDIACEVIRRGGEVIVLPQKEMPSSSPAVAILSS